MTIRSALRSGIQLCRDAGPRRMLHEGRHFAVESGFRTLHARTGATAAGENIYSRNWDVLVVLDACRVDLMKEVSPDYGFIDSVDTFHSLGSYSKEWMENNFTPEHTEQMRDTIHVTGNPFSAEALDPAWFADLDEVWRYAWDDEVGVVRPRPITDRAISQWRTSDASRMVVHYMQPHIPFLTSEYQTPLNLTDWGGVDATRNEWGMMRDGVISKEDGWTAYRENLALALDDVQVLLRNLNAQSVILTADHGNCVGEHGLWGHPAGIAVPELRHVPWVEATARDEGSYEPDTHGVERASPNDLDIDERLSALGYT